MVHEAQRNHMQCQHQCWQDRPAVDYSNDLGPGNAAVATYRSLLNPFVSFDKPASLSPSRMPPELDRGEASEHTVPGGSSTIKSMSASPFHGNFKSMSRTSAASMTF